MKTFIADIIPKIQRFSQRLDDLAKLSDQHWVSLGDIDQRKRVYIFRANNQLLISDNGVVEKGTWEHVGNQSILIDNKTGSYLLKHAFFDGNVMALKLDGSNEYAFLVNETKYVAELNNIDDVLKFLDKEYLGLRLEKLEKTEKYKPRKTIKKPPSKPKKISSRFKPEDAEILTDMQKEWIENPNFCPGCGFSGVEKEDVCPDCGLHLT